MEGSGNCALLHDGLCSFAPLRESRYCQANDAQIFLAGNFGPEKKIFAPPNSLQTPQTPSPAPSPSGIFNRNPTLPSPGASDFPFPSPEQKKKSETSTKFLVLHDKTLDRGCRIFVTVRCLSVLRTWVSCCHIKRSPTSLSSTFPEPALQFSERLEGSRSTQEPRKGFRWKILQECALPLAVAL